MKKAIAVLMATLLIFIVLGCSKTDSTDTENTVVSSEESAVYALDVQYNERKEQVKSNAELTALNEEFADLWKEKTDHYYQTAKDYFYSNGDMELVETVEDMQEEWELYYANQMKQYEEVVLSVFTTGSIVPIKLSAYDLLLNRNKAIEAYKFCLSVAITATIEAP